METPQPFDGTVRLKGGNGNWKIIALRRYSRGYCEGGGWVMEEGFKTRKEAEKAAKENGLKVL